jgi:hypothetical protein
VEGSAGPLDAARAAWQEMVSEGKVLRPGQGIALRAAQLVELDAEGELRISAPAGTPAADVLADVVARRRMEEELSRRLGRPIRIAGSTGKDPSPRVTPESARQQRLARLVEGDQGLQDLVERLDLELME